MTHRLKKEVCCVLNFWRPDSNLIISSRLQIIPTFIILSTGCYSTSFVAYYKYRFILRVEDIFIDILCTQFNTLSNCRFLYSCKWQIKPFLPNKSSVIYYVAKSRPTRFTSWRHIYRQTLFMRHLWNSRDRKQVVKICEHPWSYLNKKQLFSEEICATGH